MAYGSIKVDNIIFTNGGVDQTITVSGIVASTSGNLTVTGTISGDVIRGGTTVSGATVTGAVGQFGNLTAVSGVFTTQVSGATITGNVGQFTSVTGGTAGFTTVTGTTVTGTTANFVTVSGTTVTGTTANFTSGNFTSISGGTHTITSGVFAAGSATNPSISFASDPNTGIYSPGTDQVAISTNGTGRLFIDSSGQVGVGTSPVSTFHVNGTGRFEASQSLICNGTTGTYATWLYNGTAVGDIGTANQAVSGGGNTDFAITTRSATNLVFGIGTSERMRLDSSGRLGLGTSAPSEQFHVANADDTVVLIESTGTDSTDDARLELKTTNGTFSIQNDRSLGTSGVLTFAGNTSNNLCIDHSTGRVGIGTTNSVGKLTVATSSVNPSSGLSAWSDGYLVVTPGGTTTSGGVGFSFNTGTNVGGISCATPGSAWRDLIYTASAHRFELGGSEAARIDSSGRLLVGTSSSTSVGGVSAIVQTETETLWSSVFVRNSGSSAGPVLAFAKSRGSTAGSFTAVQNGDTLGGFYFYGANGTDYSNNAGVIACEVDGNPFTAGDTTDLPGRLVFSTTADGASSPTERMRITSAGALLVGTANVLSGAGNTASGMSFAPGDSSQLYISSNITDNIICQSRVESGTVNQIAFIYNSSVVGRITSTSTATAYNTSSDYRLKENVVAVSNGITRLQQLKPSRFNFIADPDTVVDGFIAHEAQEVVPECVTGTKDEVDDEGNPVYQGIDQSKLVPLLTAALQEAVAKIESLEARLTAAGL